MSKHAKPDQNDRQRSCGSAGHPDRVLIVPPCPPLPAEPDLEDDHLREGPSLSFAQPWRQEREPEFQPTCLWLGHNQGRLCVFAELTDRHVYSPATRFNDQRRKEGDFLELLLRPTGQHSYYELHVGPTGCRSQFHFESLHRADDLRAAYPNQDLSPFLESYEPVFEITVQVERQGNRWRVLAVVDLAKLIDLPGMMPHGTVPRRWRAAFCRHDVNRANGKVIHSSTAPFGEHNYHRHHEWHRLVLHPGADRTM